MFRIGTGAVILGVVILFALLTGGDNDNKTPTPPAASEEPSNAPPAGIACDGPEPPEAQPKTDYSDYEHLTSPDVDYSAIIDTSCGELVMDLEDKNVETVANFVFLAKEGYYDGLIWHRVEPNAVIQTGDPDGMNGEPPDGPGYTIPDEAPPKAEVYTYGVVGMANTGQPNSGGSQFFVIAHDPSGQEAAGYPPNYSILGYVDPGSYDVIEAIAGQRTIGGDHPTERVKPVTPVYINSIEIVEG
jgi:cyclophilin family peptidyl-prolyl cis-trans isomerase